MRYSSLIFVLAFAVSVLGNACAREDGARLYRTLPLAPSLTEAQVRALDTLGPTQVDLGVNFSLYSATAERVEVLLFDDPESNQPTRQFPLTRFGDVWNVFVEGIGLGQAYGFIAWGPNWKYTPNWFPGSIFGFVADVDSAGNRFNPNKLLFDPYCKAFHRDHDWSKGSIASGPKRTELTYAAAAKCVVVKSTYVWSPEEETYRQKRQDPQWAGHRFEDVILYEVHAKGFTASPASGVQHPGTYLGLAEKAEYFKTLGVTAIELLPIHEKPLDGGYWGYQTLNFFAPELSYAWRRQRQEVLDEFKFMVDALHRQGIEVFVDVVYNHTGEGGLWRERIQDDFSPDPLATSAFDPKEVAGLYSYRGLDNTSYYALAPDGQTYWNNTGVGNQTRPNHTVTRRLILDSLRFYVEEMHVDGFRFDLAPILGERDKDYANWDDPARTVLQDIVDDPVMQKYNTRLIAEAWSAGGNYGVKVAAFPASSNRPGYAWGEWNGAFRDFWRSFWNDDNAKLNSEAWNLFNDVPEDGAFLLSGSQRYYQWNARRPYHANNFITVHDGFTMYDLVSYTQKRNKCGPLNPVCCQSPLSAFCDRDSGENHNRSRDWGDEALKRQIMRNFFSAILLSHGMPMLFGGDEWMRTQLGNNNAYSTGADNEFNWFDWGSWSANPDRVRMFDFVRQLIAVRKRLAHALAPSGYGTGAKFAWKTKDNTDKTVWSDRTLLMHYYDKAAGPEVAVLINGENNVVNFTLPAGRNWVRLIDTQSALDVAGSSTQSGNAFLDAPVSVPGSNYGMAPRSTVVLEAR